jgi:hypothetical protein
VILLPAWTGTGLAVFVIARSEESATNTTVDALLFPVFGSPVVEETESVCVMVVPDATVLFTAKTRLRVAVVFAAMVVESVQVRVARTQVHPAPDSDTAVVFAGKVSINTGAAAVAGPLFVTVCV